MNKYSLWSLRLGFSGKQRNSIEKIGLPVFLEKSFVAPFDKKVPKFLDNSPKTIEELKAKRQVLKNANPNQAKELLKVELQVSQEMKAWWLQKMLEDEFPLREKMTCFWHNHFVATSQSVKVYYWIYQHNTILRENAFGNYKTLTKSILKTNAIIQYLDNNRNVNTKLNENLSRELLELFTLGIGNYTENDIKNGAKGLAGLGLGEQQAVYIPKFEVNETFEYLGKKGNLKVDEMVDAIFDHPKVAFLITKKILKWFIYDNPPDQLVDYYGKYFKSVNFEIKPLLIKIFSEEFAKKTAGSKIKDPLVFLFQVFDEVSIKPDAVLINKLLQQQGLNLFNQVNVKGWEGGRSWINSQTFQQRNTIVDIVCTSKNFIQRKMNLVEKELLENLKNDNLKVEIKWLKNSNAKSIINNFTNRLLFDTDEKLNKDLDVILKYDFDPKSEGAEFAVTRLYNSILKLPEFQLI
jgi:uncharacterized protein (DUF1800 family)